MKYKVFSVYDSKLCAFGTPRFDRMEATSIRAFTDAVNTNDKDNMLNKHPEDYSLWLVAEWDDEKGQFDSVKPKNLLGAASVFEQAPTEQKK